MAEEKKEQGKEEIHYQSNVNEIPSIEVEMLQGNPEFVQKKIKLVVKSYAPEEVLGLLDNAIARLKDISKPINKKENG